MPTTKPKKTTREHLTPEGKELKLLNAYAFWEKNPHILVDDLCKKFKTNRKDLGAWLLNNGKPRPDGRIIGKGSPRQLAIKEAYEVAAKKGETVGWAERYAEAKGFHVGKGDIRYYAMKNNLPDLKEAPPSMVRQESPNKIKL
jgi:hypothetical protein